MNSRSFLNICLGITAVLVAASLLIFSIDKATATPEPDFSAFVPGSPIPQSLGGAIMMAPFNRTLYSDDGKQTYQETDILIWDISTGKSKMYYFGFKDGQYSWMPMAYSLPPMPMK